MEVSSQLHALVPSPLGKEPAVRIVQETGRAPEQVWTLQRNCLLSVQRSHSHSAQTMQRFSSTCYTGYTQKNGAVSIVFTFETAPFFCVCPVHTVLSSLDDEAVFVRGNGVD